MADRVHPHTSPRSSAEAQTPSFQGETVVTKPSPQPPAKPVPPPGRYVIKIPKDQVYRVPPPVNARLYDQYTRRNNHRFRCCGCFCWFIGVIFILLLLVGIAAGVLYLIYHPEAPDYSINGIIIKGMNITSAEETVEISPEFDIVVRANNPNDKIGIRYLKDSSAEIFWNDVKLCNGELPAFYQPHNNVTECETALKGNGIELTKWDLRALVDAQNKRMVPMTVYFKAPVKIKVGSVETWKITVKVICDVTLDGLTTQAKIISRDCKYSVQVW